MCANDRRGPVSRRIVTFDDLRNAITAYRLPRVLIASLELNLFTAIGTDTWTIPGLARAIKVSERGLAILCRNLAMAGLLKKEGETYRNSRLGATALNAQHPAYRGDYLRLITSHWADWGRLLESVKTGLPLDHDEPDDPDYRRRFTWAMHHRTLETAPKIVAQINLRGARTLLDLGGGPGTYAMAFLSKNPRLRATVCDRPAALAVAEEIAATHKAGSRLSYLPLDLLTEVIPGTYDVIWYIERASYLFAQREPIGVPARAGCVKSWRQTADPGCVSLWPGRFVPRRGESFRGLDVAVHRARQYLFCSRNEGLVDGCWI